MSLAVTRTELLRAVGRYLGFGDDPASDWDAHQLQAALDAVTAGEAQFYAPPILPGERTAHRWSFLKQFLVLTTTAGQGDYDLPTDFGGALERLSFSANDNVWEGQLRLTGHAQILAQRQRNDGRSRPCLYAVWPLPATGEQPQRWGLSLYPIPDQEYTLSGPYLINPHGVEANTPYPLGGQPHGETLRQSVLAAAELAMDGEQGVHWNAFLQRLAASVSLDRATSGPHLFGYNTDRSIAPSIERIPTGRRRYVTYNGQEYLGE